ncbi:MAG: methylated-DNA--protein-cysteine methyltransferase [Candidatus Tectimicrobiota bacterium]|nr:MAG: methylated-DNA--protein-cysteine methyltransferase [Candidatus Tectomicrobia bacterium]
MTAVAYTIIASPLGPLLLAASEAGLTHLAFQASSRPLVPPATWVEAATPLLQAAAAQLEAYFAGRRRQFSLPLAPAGTPFQQRVWQALQRIPYGTTLSYRELAQRLGQPAAVRAVGQANGRNPIAIVIPCHRVIGHDGRLGGYAGGVALKRWLLQHEGASLV